ncbi:MAG: hypothetical protein K1W11_09710 [Akkermansia muciniphila]|uniref:hypothetical protein n=1 Tax=uncultured Akkermansia sp. TaxID=512294 RepID=UPI0026209DD6|nr:hypothetical protein [uncultured Akkermansia sp.]
MTKKTVNKSKVGKSEDMKATQEYVVRMYGDSMVCEPCCEPDEACCGDDAALRGVISASGMVRVGRRQARQGKKYHGERLKLLVEVCEKWCLFRQPWNTLFVRDAHALIDLGLLEYVKSDNGYIQVKPTETGIDRYKTIVAGVFGVEVEVA